MNYNYLSKFELVKSKPLMYFSQKFNLLVIFTNFITISLQLRMKLVAHISLIQI